MEEIEILPCSPGILNLILTPDLDDQFIERFDITIEALQGSKEYLPDGRIKRVVEVFGQKASLIKAFMLKFISNSNNQILS